MSNVSLTSIDDWLPDTGANQHVTLDLATLTGSEPYLGNDHLHIGDGKRLFISNIDHTKIHTQHHIFTLSNVLHVSHITKPLLSVHNFFLDNNVYFEFYPFVFYVKDLNTKAILLSSQNKDGLYALTRSSILLVSQAYWSHYLSAFTDLWHRRLGHPTSRIFKLLVLKNKLLVITKVLIFNVKLVH